MPRCMQAPGTFFPALNVILVLTKTRNDEGRFLLASFAEPRVRALLCVPVISYHSLHMVF